MNTQVKSSTRSPGATLLIEWRCSEARDMVQIDTNNGQNDFGSLSQKKKRFWFPGQSVTSRAEPIYFWLKVVDWLLTMNVTRSCAGYGNIHGKPSAVQCPSWCQDICCKLNSTSKTKWCLAHSESQTEFCTMRLILFQLLCSTFVISIIVCSSVSFYFLNRIPFLR